MRKRGTGSGWSSWDSRQLSRKDPQDPDPASQAAAMFERALMPRCPGGIQCGPPTSTQLVLRDVRGRQKQKMSRHGDRKAHNNGDTETRGDQHAESSTYQVQVLAGLAEEEAFHPVLLGLVDDMMQRGVAAPKRHDTHLSRGTCQPRPHTWHEQFCNNRHEGWGPSISEVMFHLKRGFAAMPGGEVEGNRPAKGTVHTVRRTGPKFRRLV